MPHPGSPESETNGTGWHSSILISLGRYRFLLLLVAPIAVVAIAVWWYARTNGSVETIYQLYDSFPSSYETVSPHTQSDLTPVERVSVAESGGVSNVNVMVSRTQEFRARIIWLTAIFTFLVVSACAAVISVWVAWESLRDGRFWVLTGLYVVLAVWAPFALGDLIAARAPCETVGADSSVLECRRSIATDPDLTVLSFRIVFGPLESLDPAFYRFSWAMHAGYATILSIVMVLLGTAAAATIAAPPGRSKRTPSFQSGQMQRGQIFLYSASAVLTFALIYNSAWLRWPVELMPQGALRGELSSYVASVVGFLGVVASAMLLAIYIPMALIHRRQARRLAHEALAERPETAGTKVDREDVQEFLEANHLQVPLFSQLQRIGAMLLPALVHPIASAFEVLTSAAS